MCRTQAWDLCVLRPRSLTYVWTLTYSSFGSLYSSALLRYAPLTEGLKLCTLTRCLHTAVLPASPLHVMSHGDGDWLRQYVDDNCAQILRLLSTGQAHSPLSVHCHFDNPGSSSTLQMNAAGPFGGGGRVSPAHLQPPALDGAVSWLDLVCFAWGCVSLMCTALRADLLELAIAFRGVDKSWGQLRILERWVDKQPWRTMLPQAFQRLAFAESLKIRFEEGTACSSGSNSRQWLSGSGSGSTLCCRGVGNL